MKEFLSTSKRFIAGALASLLVLTSAPDAAMNVYAEEDEDIEVYAPDEVTPDEVTPDEVTPDYAEPEPDIVEPVGVTNGEIKVNLILEGGGFKEIGTNTVEYLALSEINSLNMAEPVEGTGEWVYTLHYDDTEGAVTNEIAFDISGILDKEDLIKTLYGVAYRTSVSIDVEDGIEGNSAGDASLDVVFDRNTQVATGSKEGSSLQELIAAAAAAAATVEGSSPSIDVTVTVTEASALPINVTVTGAGSKNATPNATANFKLAEEDGISYEKTGSAVPYVYNFLYDPVLTGTSVNNSITFDINDILAEDVEDGFTISDATVTFKGKKVVHDGGSSYSWADYEPTMTLTYEDGQLTGTFATPTFEYDNVQGVMNNQTAKRSENPVTESDEGIYYFTSIDVDLDFDQVYSVPVEVTFTGDGVKTGFTTTNTVLGLKNKPIVGAENPLTLGGEVTLSVADYAFAFDPLNEIGEDDVIVIDLSEMSDCIKDGYTINKRGITATGVTDEGADKVYYTPTSVIDENTVDNFVLSESTLTLRSATVGGFKKDFGNGSNTNVSKVTITIPVTSILSIPAEISFTGAGVVTDYTAVNVIGGEGDDAVITATGLDLAYTAAKTQPEVTPATYALSFAEADVDLEANTLVLDINGVFADGNPYIKEGYNLDSIAANGVALTLYKLTDTTYSTLANPGVTASYDKTTGKITITCPDTTTFDDLINATTYPLRKIGINIAVATAVKYDVNVEREDNGVGVVKYTKNNDAEATLGLDDDKGKIGDVTYGSTIKFNVAKNSLPLEDGVPVDAKFVLVKDDVADFVDSTKTPGYEYLDYGLTATDNHAGAILNPTISGFNDGQIKEGEAPNQVVVRDNSYVYTIKDNREVKFATATISAKSSDTTVATISKTDGLVAGNYQVPGLAETAAADLVFAKANADFKFDVTSVDGKAFATSTTIGTTDYTFKGIKSVSYTAVGASEPTYLFNLTAPANKNKLTIADNFVLSADNTVVTVTIDKKLVAEAVEAGATTIDVEPVVDNVYNVTLNYAPEYNADGEVVKDAVASGDFGTLTFAVGTDDEVIKPTSDIAVSNKKALDLSKVVGDGGAWTAVLEDPEDPTSKILYYEAKVVNIPKNSRVVALNSPAKRDEGQFFYVGESATAAKSIFEYEFVPATTSPAVPASQTGTILIPEITADKTYYVDSRSSAVLEPEKLDDAVAISAYGAFVPTLTVARFTTGWTPLAKATGEVAKFDADLSYGNVSFTTTYNADVYTLEDFGYVFTDAEGNPVEGTEVSFFANDPYEDPIIFPEDADTDEKKNAIRAAERQALIDADAPFYTTKTATGNMVTNTYHIPKSAIIAALDGNYDIQLTYAGLETKLLTITAAGLTDISDNVFVKYTVYKPDATIPHDGSAFEVVSGAEYKKVTEWTLVGPTGLIVEVPHSLGEVPGRDDGAEYVGLGHVTIDSLAVLDVDKKTLEPIDGSVIAGPVLYAAGHNNYGPDFTVNSDGTYSGLSYPKAVQPKSGATTAAGGYVDKTFYPNSDESTFALTFGGYAGQSSTATTTQFGTYTRDQNLVGLVTLTNAPKVVDTDGNEQTPTDALVSEISYVSSMNDANGKVLYTTIGEKNTKIGEMYTGGSVAYTADDPATIAVDPKWAVTVTDDVKFTVNSATVSDSAVYSVSKVELSVDGGTKYTELTPDSDGVYTLSAEELQKLLPESADSFADACALSNTPVLQVTQVRKAANYQTVNFWGWERGTGNTNTTAEEWNVSVVDENGTVYKVTPDELLVEGIHKPVYTAKLPAGMNMVVTATIADESADAFKFNGDASKYKTAVSTINGVSVSEDGLTATLNYTVPDTTDDVYVAVLPQIRIRWTQDGETFNYASDNDMIDVIYNKNVSLEVVQGTTSLTFTGPTTTDPAGLILETTGRTGDNKAVVNLGGTPNPRTTVTVTLKAGADHVIKLKTSDPDREGAYIDGTKARGANLTAGEVVTFPLSVTEFMEPNNTVVVFGTDGKAINNIATTAAQYNMMPVTATIEEDGNLVVNTRGGSTGSPWNVVILDKNNKDYGSAAAAAIGVDTTLAEVEEAGAVAGKLTLFINNPTFAGIAPGATITSTTIDAAQLSLSVPAIVNTALNDVYYEIHAYLYDTVEGEYPEAPTVTRFVPITEKSYSVPLYATGQYMIKVGIVQTDVDGNVVVNDSDWTTALTSKGEDSVSVAGEAGGVYETKLKLNKGAGYAAKVNNRNTATLAFATAKWSKKTNVRKLEHVDLINKATGMIVSTETLAVGNNAAGTSVHYVANNNNVTFNGIDSACTIYLNPYGLPAGQYTIKAYAAQASGAPRVTASMSFTVLDGIEGMTLTATPGYVYNAKKATVKTALTFYTYDEHDDEWYETKFTGDKTVAYKFMDAQGNLVDSLAGMTFDKKKKGTVIVPKGTPIGEYTVVAVAPFPADEPVTSLDLADEPDFDEEDVLGAATFEVLGSPAAISTIEINGEPVLNNAEYLAGLFDREDGSMNITLIGTVNGDEKADITGGYSIKVTGAAKGNKECKFVKPGTMTITCTPLGNVAPKKSVFKIKLKATKSPSYVSLYSEGEELLDEELEKTAEEEGEYLNPAAVNVTNNAAGGEYVYVILWGNDEIEGEPYKTLTSDTVKKIKGGKVAKTIQTSMAKVLAIRPNAPQTVVTITNKTTGTNMVITINNAAIKTAKTDPKITVTAKSASGVQANTDMKGKVYNKIDYKSWDATAARYGFDTYEEMLEAGTAPNVVTYTVQGALASADGKKKVRVTTTSPVVSSALVQMIGAGVVPVEGSGSIVTKGQTIYGNSVAAGSYPGAYIIELDENDSFVIPFTDIGGYANFKKGTYKFKVTSVAYDDDDAVTGATKAATVSVKAVAAPTSKITLNTKLKFADSTSCNAPITIKKSNVNAKFITMDHAKVGNVASVNTKGALNQFPRYYTLYTNTKTKLPSICFNYGAFIDAKQAKSKKLLSGYVPVAYRNANGSVTKKYVKVSITAKNGLNYFADSLR